jgi:hypothetical protein
MPDITMKLELTDRIWHHYYRTNLVQIASLLRADMIFGKNRGLSYARHRTAPALRSVVII